MTIRSILIAALTASFISNIEQSPAIPAEVKSQASVKLEAGVPFLSDAQLESALDEAGTSSEVSQAALDANADARIDGLQIALAVLAFMALIALFFAQQIPTKQPSTAPP